MDFQQDKVTNPYLSRAVEWEETEVFNYKKKKRRQLLAPWMTAVLLLGIYAVVGMATWALNVCASVFQISALVSVFNTLKTGLVPIILLAVFVVASAILGLIDAKRLNQRFILDNRGEVGHNRKPYSRGIKLGLIISGVVFVLAVAGVIVISYIMCGADKAERAENLISMDPLGMLVCVIGAALYPLVYHIRSIFVLKAFNSDTCPVCMRSNFRLLKRAGDKSEDKVLTKQISYTPGKIAYVYGQFMIDKTANKREIDDDAFITYCRYCSLYVKGNGTEKLD